jgi:transcriptional regulator with XRE-family HTH domain
MTNLSLKLKELRMKHDLTQEEFAEKIGTSRASVSSWEISRAEPDLDTCKRIAAFFKISLDELLDAGDGYLHLVPVPKLESDEMNKKFEGYDPELINYAMVKIKQAISGLSPEEAKQKVKQMILTLKVMEEIENSNKKSD